MFKWSESFYDKDINVVKDIIAKGSDNKIVYVEYLNEVTEEPDYDKALDALK